MYILDHADGVLLDLLTSRYRRLCLNPSDYFTFSFNSLTRTSPSDCISFRFNLMNTRSEYNEIHSNEYCIFIYCGHTHN